MGGVGGKEWRVVSKGERVGARAGGEGGKEGPVSVTIPRDG